MYRTFLSWRYLRARLTNLIGIVGITLAVGALILILSIMTGFLEETKRTVRGNLADLIVSPIQDARSVTGEPVPKDARVAQRILARDPRVAAASPRLVWYGLIAQGGDRAGHSREVLTDSEAGRMMGVQLVGVDVRSHERLGGPLLAASLGLLGVPFVPERVQDDFDTTDLLAGLSRDPHPRRLGAPVDNPLDPFRPPAVRRRDNGPSRAAVVVGEQLFSSLRLRRGDELELATVVPDPLTGKVAISNRKFLVAGSFRSGENEMDLERIYLDRRELGDFLGGNLSFSEILVKTRDYDAHGRRLAVDMERALAEGGAIWWNGIEDDLGRRGQVRTWEDFRRTLLGAIENERVLMAIMLSLILLVAGFTIFAILTMMVAEKRRDIGILTALGAPPSGILATFLLIGFWDAVLGATMGAILGVQGALHIDRIEQWLSGVLGVQIFNRDVYFFDRIPAVVEPGPVAMIVGGAFAITLACAAVPAWRAARLDPLVALRYE